MPSFGSLLKKKRTKDSPGSKDPTSPISPIYENNSAKAVQPLTNPAPAAPAPAVLQNTGAPITQTRSNVSQLSHITTTESNPQVAIAESSHNPVESAQPVQPVQSAQPAMQGMPYHQYAGQDQAQNLPSISNLINPPQQGDNYGNSNMGQGTNAATPSNGGGLHQLQYQPEQQQQQFTPQQPQVVVPRTTKGKYTLQDFEILRTLGTGSFGRVHLVQSKHNQRFYAVKVLKKQQVVKMKQVEHTNDERKMLQEVKHPFLITLWGTFQDSKNLYMVMDFVEGGELFSLLRKSQVCATVIVSCATSNM